MNRAKIWGFTLLVLAAGAINVYLVTQRAVDQAMDHVGSSLRAGVTQFEAGTRLLARQVNDVAVLAARDPELVAALADAATESKAPQKTVRRGSVAPPSEPVDVVSEAEKALRGAAQALDVDASKAPFLALASETAVSFRVGDKPLSGKEAVVQAVLGAPGGGRYARIDDALYYVVAVPVTRGATLAFGLPLESRLPERLKVATGADLTILSGAKAPSTLPVADVQAVILTAKKGAGAAVDGGRLGPVRLPLSLSLPAVPLLFAKVPAFRARALPLTGIEGPAAVVSVATRTWLEPVALYQQLSLLALGVLFLTGLALGLLPERIVTAHVPRELASVADRIARGDFEARVPRMSGTFGILASALNRAADAARMARVAPSVSLPPTGVAIPPSAPANTLDVPLLAVPPQEPFPGSGLFDEPFGAAAAPAPSNAPLNGTVPSQPTPLPFPPPAPQRTGTARFEAAEPLAAQTPLRVATPPPAPAPAPPEAEEAGWQGVYQDFLKVREECGESLEGLTWDRFRQKLRKNRDSLVQKYACRTVRFQVYVKEGKAALKATPVR
jgi:HAMP domain-containing protein